MTPFGCGSNNYDGMVNVFLLFNGSQSFLVAELMIQILLSMQVEGQGVQIEIVCRVVDDFEDYHISWSADKKPGWDMLLADSQQ